MVSIFVAVSAGVVVVAVMVSLWEEVVAVVSDCMAVVVMVSIRVVVVVSVSMLVEVLSVGAV